MNRSIDTERCVCWEQEETGPAGCGKPGDRLVMRPAGLSADKLCAAPVEYDLLWHVVATVGWHPLGVGRPAGLLAFSQRC
jgi:hypothetical protein